jgi:hypothetical protein
MIFPLWPIKSPTAVGAVSSAVVSVKPREATHLYGVHVAGRRRLSLFRCQNLDSK